MKDQYTVPHWHRQLQEAIAQIGLVYCLNSQDLLPFLTATLSGQFALAELSEEKVKATLDRMFDSYKKIKERMEREGK